MDDSEVGKLWDGNAEAWTLLARMGCDVYRDYVNTPAFLRMLPEVEGLHGLDIGCGEGHNTRLVAARGARMTAVDISPRFIRYARDREREEPHGIVYLNASGCALPFPGESFDFVVAFMSLMDMAGHEEGVRESYRVLRAGGFFQFSILHPCFATPRMRWLRDEEGNRTGIECGDYFSERQGVVEEWTFGAAPQELKERLPKFKVPRFFRTLTSWVRMVVEAGFLIDGLQEPCADDEAVERCPDVADTRIVPIFMQLRCRK